MKSITSSTREQGDDDDNYYYDDDVVMLVLCLICSAQFGTTYVKKLIEDNCTMDETVRFFAVSVYWDR